MYVSNSKDVKRLIEEVKKCDDMESKGDIFLKKSDPSHWITTKTDTMTKTKIEDEDKD